MNHNCNEVPPHIIRPEELADLKSTRVNNCDLAKNINTTQRNKIVWLLGSGDNFKRRKYITAQFQKFAPHLLSYIKFIEVNKPGLKFWVNKPKTKATKMITPDYPEIIHRTLGVNMNTARVIVLNDFAALAATLASTTGTGSKKTLSVFRGSTYVNELWSGVPAYVIEDASKCYGWQPPTSSSQEHSKIDNIQYFEIDIHRIVKLYDNPLSCVDKFDERFTIVNCEYPKDAHTYGGCGNEKFINKKDFIEWLDKQSILALDFETVRMHQSVLSVTGLENYDINTAQTWVIPQYQISEHCYNNLHMSAGAYTSLVGKVMSHNSPKIWFNGNYDLQYELIYHDVYPHQDDYKQKKGIHHDAMLLWHAFRPTLKQSLATVTSIFCPSYYYWKDEIKGDRSSRDKESSGHSMPHQRSGFITYLRYAGLDTWNTMLCWHAMVAEHNFLADPRVFRNYIKELTLLRGPLLETNMLGCELDRNWLQKEIIQKNKIKTSQAIDNLIVASNSIIEKDNVTPAKIGEWIYGALALPVEERDKKRIAKAARAGKVSSPSTNIKVLRLVGEINPIATAAVKLVQDYSKPDQIISMYDKLKYPTANGRARLRTNYSFRPYTGRLNSTGSAFWDGTNMQNVPKDTRGMCLASPGHILIDIDYSQSDSYHFAVACQDPKMLEVTFNDKDTHAQHVEMIFKVPYDDIMKGKKDEDDFIVHPVTGLRQIIKKLCHGGNYGMEGESAYANAGREALLVAAKIMGINTVNWSRKDFYNFINFLLSPYFENYATMLPWRNEIVQNCIENDGWVECYGGHAVYFPQHKYPSMRAELCRALLAFYGQGGTGSMINQAMHRLYYGSWDKDSKRVIYHAGEKSIFQTYQARIIFQNHDSFLFELPLNQLTPESLNAILTAMELPCKFNNKEYVVPCEADIGFRWGKDMISVGRWSNSNDLTLASLASFVEQHR